MSQTDNPQPQTCKNCLEPVVEGSIGITSGMCVSCSASHGEPQQQISALQEASEDTIELETETNSPAQYQTEQAAYAGVDKSAEERRDDEITNTENNKAAIVTGSTTPAEEDSPPFNDNKVCIFPTSPPC